MMLRWKLRSTDEFYKDLLFLSAGGALALIPCTLAAWLLAATPVAAAVACGIAGTLTMFLSLKARRPRLKLLPGATASVLSGSALGLLTPFSPVAGCLAFGGFFGLSQAGLYPSWNQKLSLIASSSAAALLGGVVFGQLSWIAPAVGASLQPVVMAGLYGLFGFYMGLGSLPAHVRVRRDLVGTTYAQLAGRLRPAIKDYVSRAYALYGRFAKQLPEAAGMESQQIERFEDDLDRLILKIFTLCARWQELEVTLTSFKADELQARIREMEDRATSSRDDRARSQYEATRDALVARTRDYQDLSRIKERIVSGLTLYFTRLEALHFTIIKARCVDTHEVTAEIDGLFRNVSELTDDMDATTRTLEELAGGALSAVATSAMVGNALEELPASTGAIEGNAPAQPASIVLTAPVEEVPVEVPCETQAGSVAPGEASVAPTPEGSGSGNREIA